jgi:8-oxo-dGTP diphosphatase
MGEVKTNLQVSAGGVAYRVQDGQVQIALISVGESNRWQLPKGRVDKDESNEAAAMREVREETGIVTELVGLIDKIDYWFYASGRGGRYRVHKYVYFFLLRHLSGETSDHDQEVNEARWVEIDQAIEMLNFESEKEVARKAKALIAEDLDR